MVEVVLADVDEVPPPELVEVHRVVHPFLGHVAHEHGGQEYGGGRQGGEEAQQREQDRDGDGVEPTVDVQTVPRPQVMVPVRGVEEAVDPVIEAPPRVTTVLPLVRRYQSGGGDVKPEARQRADTPAGPAMRPAHEV